jgi:adenine phosphoribosyltransferase
VIGPELAERLAALVRDVEDYPSPGILFKDITPLLADGPAFAAAVDAFVEHAHSVGPVDAVAGIESRGFILGAPVAAKLGVGFVPIRKQGKLPWRTFSAGYDLEYGQAVIEIHEDAFAPRARVIVVDDVLATGGTAAAALDLVARAGATPVGFTVLVELGFLDGRSKLAGHDVHAVLTA